VEPVSFAPLNRKPYLLARHARVMLGEHSVDVLVEFSRTGLVVDGKHEAEVDAASNQLLNDGVVRLVPACTVPTEEDRALEVSVTEVAGKTMELWTLDIELHGAILVDNHRIAAFEGRMLFAYHAIAAEARDV